MDNKTYTVSLDVDKVRSVNISRYSDGYNYANVSSKMSDDEYMSISYEWKGKQIPEFAMNVMEIMKGAGTEKAAVDDNTIACIERASVVLADYAAKMKKKEKKKDDEEDDTNKFPFTKKEKKAKKKKDC